MVRGKKDCLYAAILVWCCISLLAPLVLESLVWTIYDDSGIQTKPCITLYINMMYPMFLNCPFLIALSIFFNVNLDSCLFFVFPGLLLFIRITLPDITANEPYKYAFFIRICPLCRACVTILRFHLFLGNL